MKSKIATNKPNKHKAGQCTAEYGPVPRELGLILPHMTQKPMLRSEVDAHALRV